MIHIRTLLKRLAHVKVQLVIHATFNQSDNVYRLKNVGDNSYLKSVGAADERNHPKTYHRCSKSAH